MIILHTADWHLRESQYGDFDRGLEFFQAAKRLTSKAIDLFRAGKIDCIVNGGDILDKKRPPSVVIHQLMEINEMLVDAGLPMFTITGNHDQDDPSWISLNYKYKDRGIVPLDNTIVDYKGMKMTGIMATTKNKIELALAQINEKIDIIVWHGAIKESAAFDDGSYISVGDFLDFSEHLGTRLFLLGDIHKTQYYEKKRKDGTNTLTGYPGSIEMANTQESGNKTFTLIDTENLNCELVPLESRPFIEIDLKDAAALDSGIKALTSTGKSALISVTYYLDERLSLFNSLNLVLRTRETTFSDIIRFSNESPSSVVVSEEERSTGNVTLPGITVERFKNTNLTPTALELINKTANHEKIIENFVQERLNTIL